jgi:hypothetical protein
MRNLDLVKTEEGGEFGFGGPRERMGVKEGT